MSDSRSWRDAARWVRAHRVPEWWTDAKLGIFVHWTPASVPGFAPTDEAIGDLIARSDPSALAHSPYTEWYENSLRFPGSPVAQHHAATHGTRPYRDFARDWEAALDGWQPDEWARDFAATGARYVVLVAKHHDGYCLWPTAVENPHVPRWHCPRDVVGELAEAVRAAGMRFGLYYSGGLDWTWNEHPIGAFSDLLVATPRGGYPAYARAQVEELVARYHPSVLWNDISWPTPASQLAPLLADYYASVPEGVINDRFLCWSPMWSLARAGAVRRVVDGLVARAARKERGIVPPKPRFFDVRTPEYTVFDDIQRTPWECVRGMDKSFGYNRASSDEDFITHSELLWSFVDIVAKGGNLLLNVGPRGEDATIPDPQLRRLEWLAAFTSEHGRALFGTRPWSGAVGDAVDVTDVRYTSRDAEVFAFARDDVVRGVGPARVLALGSRPGSGLTAGRTIGDHAMAEDAGIASEAWYETNTVAAIDAFYWDGDVKANLESARRLLQSDASLQEIIEQLDDDRRDAEFRHPVQGSPLRGPEFERVTKHGYLEAIALALAHDDPVPIKTFWRIWDGDAFKMLVTDGRRQVSVTLVIPRKRLGGRELQASSTRESWVVDADGDTVQTSGPPEEQRPSLR